MAIDINKYKQAQAASKSSSDGGQGFDLSEFLNRDIKLFGGGMNDRKKERFYTELHALLSSGIDIVTTLQLLEEEQKKVSFFTKLSALFTAGIETVAATDLPEEETVTSKDKQIFRDIREDLVNGKALHNAMENSGQFSPYEYYSIKIGEETGQLETVLKELSEFYTEKIKQKQKFVSAISYPIVVIITAIGAVIFLLNFIVPLFADVFIRFGGELPLITKLVLDMSAFVGDYLWYLLAFIVIMVAFIYFQSKKDWFRKWSSAALVFLPFGELVRKIYLSRFCRSMALLISSDVPILSSIELVQKMIRFYPVEKSLTDIRQKIMEGSSLHQSMAGYSIYDNKFVSMIKVGEEVNQLDTMFNRLGDQYNTEVEHKISMLSSLLEPFLILFLGAVIGTILIAIYLPIFELSTNIL